MTNVAAHRGDGGLTEVTPDDVLGAVLGVHGLKTSIQPDEILKKYKNHVIKLINCSIVQKSLGFCFPLNRPIFKVWPKYKTTVSVNNAFN